VTKRETRTAGKGASAARPTETGETLRAAFGVNFKAARIKAGLTQTDITEITGIAQTYVSSIERGQQNLTLDTLATLAEAIGADARALLKPLPPPSPAKPRKRSAS
jgi:transcriptional regulator with XRE-family HTH domain